MGLGEGERRVLGGHAVGETVRGMLDGGEGVGMLPKNY